MSNRSATIRNFLLGGLLPLIAFTLVEQFYGTVGGVIAGVVFGGGEILWEYFRIGKVQAITWFSNALVLILGTASLWENSGVYFKLQPAIFMFVFAGIFLGSSFLKRPFFVALLRKQNSHIPPILLSRFQGLNTRLGFYFIALGGISAYSALYWSTAVWAGLKAIGLPVLTIGYLLLEVLWLRYSLRNSR